MQASAVLLSAACLLAIAVLGAEAAPKQRTLPAYVKTCSRNDPKLNECALKNGREILPKIMKGDSSIKLPPLEPLFLPQVAITTAGGARGGGLQLVCTNCNIHGLSGAQLNDVKFNMKKNHLDIKVFLPMLSVVGKYKVDGKLLLFPVYGNGDANLTLYDLDVTAGLDWKLIKKKGEEYGRLSSHSVDFVASNFKLSLTGLFNGDKALNDNMNQILNDNWKDILNDLKPSISDTVGQILKLILNQIFDIVPFDQVIPPK